MDRLPETPRVPWDNESLSEKGWSNDKYRYMKGLIRQLRSLFSDVAKRVNFLLGLSNNDIYTVTLADDAFTTITPKTGHEAGILIVHDVSNWQHDLIAHYWIYSTGAQMASMAATGIDVTTGALAGTTGVDGHVTVSTHTDGKLYIENRLGSSSKFALQLLAGATG